MSSFLSHAASFTSTWPNSRTISIAIPHASHHIILFSDLGTHQLQFTGSSTLISAEYPASGNHLVFCFVAQLIPSVCHLICMQTWKFYLCFTSTGDKIKSSGLLVEYRKVWSNNSFKSIWKVNVWNWIKWSYIFLSYVKKTKQKCFTHLLLHFYWLAALENLKHCTKDLMKFVVIQYIDHIPLSNKSWNIFTKNEDNFTKQVASVF